MSGSDLQWVPMSVGLYSSVCCSLWAGKPLVCLGLFMSVLVSLCFSLSLTDGAPAGTEEEGPEGQGQGEGRKQQGKEKDREEDGEGDTERREQVRGSL